MSRREPELDLPDLLPSTQLAVDTPSVSARTVSAENYLGVHAPCTHQITTLRYAHPMRIASLRARELNSATPLIDNTADKARTHVNRSKTIGGGENRREDCEE